MRPFQQKPKLNLEHILMCSKYSKLPRKFFVEFALSCANEIRHLVNPKHSIKLLDITALWLEDKATKEEVVQIVDRAYSDYYYNDPTYQYYIRAALYAAYVTYPYDFMYSTYHSVYNTARAILPDNPEIKEEEYAQRFLDKVNSLTKVEKLLYGIEG